MYTNARRSTLFVVANEPTAVEQEAILLRWRNFHPDAPADANPTPEEADQLLAEIRERASAIEAQAVAMLKQQLKIKDATGQRSRHTVFFYTVLLVVVAAF